MKTNVTLKRHSIQGVEVLQRTSDGFFNLTELTKAFGKQPKDWLKNKQASRIISCVSVRGNIQPSDLVIVINGDGGATWVHPILFLKYMMFLSPSFEYRALKMVQDNLIQLRNETGDARKTLANAIAKWREDTGANREDYNDCA